MTEPAKPSAPPPQEPFLSRWSRRKVEAEVPAGAAGAGQGDAAARSPGAPETEPVQASAAGRAPLPPVESLTHEADFTPFMAREVEPGLRNQAMKKLFTDPHYRFDHMDKLDIYIDDYSQSEPIPLEMLKMMHQARSLGLFDEEDKKKAAQVESTVAPPPGELPPEPIAAAPAVEADLPPDAESMPLAPAAVTAPLPPSK